MDKHLGEIFQGEDGLLPIVYGPPFLGVGFNHTLATKERFEALLQEMKRLLHKPFPIWPEGGLGNQLYPIPPAEFVHPAAAELPAFVCNDFEGQPRRRPLLLGDGDTIPPTPLYFVLDTVSQTPHYR